MFAALSPAEPDPILANMAAFRADPRHGKIDLGVGVYRNAAGETPIFAAVRDAEARLHEVQSTKSYVGLLGDLGYVADLGKLAFGEGRRPAGAQAVGGSGALFCLGRLIRAADKAATVHLPTPTWPNHRNLFGQGAGLAIAEYPYLSADRRSVDVAAMIAAFDRLGPSDVVVLHACCHNPTGIDIPTEAWPAVAASAAARGWVPLFDMAYQGFGDGLEEDAAGMRLVLDAVGEAMAAVSCSKNFGLYRERAGAAYAFAGSARAAVALADRMAAVNREHLSMPPDHGGALVRLVLENPERRAMWEAELSTMRARIRTLREGLDAALLAVDGGARWAGFSKGRGLFATLPLTPAQIEALKDEHAIYVIPGGRLNVAGLPDDGAPQVAAALASLA